MQKSLNTSVSISVEHVLFHHPHIKFLFLCYLPPVLKLPQTHSSDGVPTVKCLITEVVQNLGETHIFHSPNLILEVVRQIIASFFH